MCEGNWLSMLLNTNMNLRMGFDELAASVPQLVDISNIILLPPAAVHCATSRKVADPIPNVVIGTFH